jgi:hypothetical protein
MVVLCLWPFIPFEGHETRALILVETVTPLVIAPHLCLQCLQCLDKSFSTLYYPKSLKAVLEHYFSTVQQRQKRLRTCSSQRVITRPRGEREAGGAWSYTLRPTT